MPHLIKISEGVEAAFRGCNFLALLVRTQPVKGIVPEALHLKRNSQRGSVLQEEVAKLFVFEK